MTTRKPRVAPSTRTFSTQEEAGRLPYEGKSPEKWWRHSGTEGFYVAVSKPAVRPGDPKGKAPWSQRSYGVRYKEVVGGKEKDRKVKFATVGEMALKDAQTEASNRLQRARKAATAGVSLLPTLKEAFDEYIDFATTGREDDEKLGPVTVKDYTRRFEEYVPEEWHNTPLDELTASAWAGLRKDITTDASWDELGQKPRKGGRFDNLLKGVISGVYRDQRERKGFKSLVNPVSELRAQKVIGKYKPRFAFVPSPKLTALWQAMESDMRGPQRDIARIGLLTGWRISLMCAIPLDRIKEDKRAVEWRSTDPGGPYVEQDGDRFDYPVSDWLWNTVFAPRLATVQRGQKYLIESGRSTTGAFTDIRDTLKKLDPVVGVHVSAHVLRRTFATHCLSARIPARTVEQLMMHKANTQTADYQPRDFDAMKVGVNEYTAWFLAKVGEVDASAAAAVAPAPAPQPAIAGLTDEKMETLQKLASMPTETLEMLMKFAAAMK